MLVQRPDKPYVALLNGLKAVKQENVVVTGISTKHTKENVDTLLDHLSNIRLLTLIKTCRHLIQDY